MSALLSPEVKIAQRILKKHGLVAPIDVQKLLESYADLEFKSFPTGLEGIDGIAINIKVPGKRPLVVINSEIAITRQRFTMAHELAHLVIPWHTGIKFDDAAIASERAQAYSELMYRNLESEANSFAAEILMPGDFLRDVVATTSDLATAHREICRQLNVSPPAAAIKMGQTLPPGIVYCIVKNGLVQNSGKTEATSVEQPRWGESFNHNLYPSAELSTWPASGFDYYWWRFSLNVPVNLIQDDRPWRKILDEILLSSVPASELTAYKLRIGGIFGSINGKLKGTKDYTLDSVLGVCYQRFDTDEFRFLITHEKFHAFLQKRVGEIMNK